MARKKDASDDEDDFSLDEESDEEEVDASDGSSDSDAEVSTSQSDDEPLSDEGASDFEDEPKPKKAKTSAATAAKKSATKTPAKSKSPAPVKPGKKAPSAPIAPAKPRAKASTKTGSGASPVKSSGGNAATATPPKNPEQYVLDYMKKTNRPYSLLNVFENLHKAIAKPALTRLLDGLVDKQELTSKTYGKAKIYFVNQDNLPVPSEEERAQVETQIRQLEETCGELEQELKVSEATLNGINAQISDADLESTLKRLEDEAATLTTKLASLERPDRKPVSPGRKDALKRKFNTYKTAWVKRKRMAMDVVDQIAEGMEKKPKDIIALCGVETDAEAGVSEIPSI